MSSLLETLELIDNFSLNHNLVLNETVAFNKHSNTSLSTYQSFLFTFKCIAFLILIIFSLVSRATVTLF